MKLTQDHVARLAELQTSAGIFEHLIRCLYRHVLRPGDAAVDGGALVGDHTSAMADAVGPSGSVLAFEPVPDMARYLSTLFADRPNISVIAKALSDRSGTARFYSFPDAPWFSSLADRFPWFDALPDAEKPGVSRTQQTEIEVVTTTLDNYSGHAVRFVKLDIEGGEYAALLGGRRLLATHRPVVCLECAGRDQAEVFGYTWDEFNGLFTAAGYGLMDLYGRDYTRAAFEHHKLHAGVPGYLIAFPAVHGEVRGIAEANAIAAAMAGEGLP